MTMQFVFVGEKRSNRAIQMDVTWQDGHLAARTLHAALRACKLDPHEHVYLNLFVDGDGFTLAPLATEQLHSLLAQGYTVVGMGQRVQRVLQAAEITHLTLIHPAARGAIRATPKYQAHVATVLGQAA